MEGEEPTTEVNAEGNVEKLGTAEDVAGSRKPEQKASTRRFTLLLMAAALVVVLAWSITMTVLYANSDDDNDDDDGGNQQSANQLSFECPEDCICSVEAYADAFASTLSPTESSALGRPACVGGHLMGIVISLPEGSSDLPIDLKSNGGGRRVAFVAGSSFLERALVYGQFDTSSLLVNIGYGEMPDVTGKDFYILVFERPEVVYQGYWSHLDNILNEIYGDALPEVDEAITELVQDLFSDASGCTENPEYLGGGLFNTTTCDACFQEATERFKRVDCTGPDAMSPIYTPQANCSAEEAFLSIKGAVTACELRAYLFTTQGFFFEYTGYGYTANEYRDPLLREFWLPNGPIADLKNAKFIKLLE
jgi:hypothetical protein